MTDSGRLFWPPSPAAAACVFKWASDHLAMTPSTFEQRVARPAADVLDSSLGRIGL
jgi:hypothetical protein